MNKKYEHKKVIMMPADLGARVCLKDSDIHGVGLFAKEDIPKRTLIQYTHVYHPDHESWINLNPNYKFNHSKTRENCELVLMETVMGLKSLIDIEKDQELLVDYTKNKQVEQPEEGWEL